MRRLLITGATGFVGAHLTAAVGEAFEVLALGGPGGNGQGLDVLDADAVDAAVRSFAPDAIVHLAAASSVAQAGKDPVATWDINLLGARNVAVAARALRRPVKLIFPSSAEVYGRAFLDGPRAETDRPDPASSYGRSKLAAEGLLQDLADDHLQVVALRLFNHTGPGQDVRFVVPSFAEQIARLERQDLGAPIRVGNLEAQRDFSAISDIVEAYLAVLRGHPDRLRPSDIPVAQGLFSRFMTDYGWRPNTPFDVVLDAVLQERRAARDVAAELGKPS